ncbi:MAG: helix-turn-helix domain-containing protein [Hyphomicrobiales bacterium]|nr:helix-turn-helix domain-containing protein [Hyphomicrobiales bacterium]
MDQFKSQTRQTQSQGKQAILAKSNLSPLVVSLPEAAALIGLSKNTARQFFNDRAVPIIRLGGSRKVIRISDLVRVLEEMVKEDANV